MNRNILILLFACFLDMLSYAIFSPVVPFLFLEGEYSLFPSDFQNRYLVFGFFLSTYSLTQVFSSPLLGKLSLRLSKKIVLMGSFVGNVLGYLLCAYGIYHKQVLFLFIGSGTAGLTGANMSMINAFISSETDSSHWSRNYSLFGSIIGVSFIVGPQISSFFINAFDGFDTFYFLLLFCSFISIFNCFIVYSFVRETKIPESENYDSRKPMLEKIPSLFKLDKHILPIFIFLFCIYFSWLSFIKFFQVYLVDVFSLNESDCCQMTSYLGFCCCLWQGLRYLIKHEFTDRYGWLAFCTFLMLVNFSLYSFVEETFSLLFITLAISFSYAALTPAILSLLFKKGDSPHAYKSSWYQSLKALAQILAPLSSGYILSQDWISPNALTVFVMLFACILLVKKRSLFQSESGS